MMRKAFATWLRELANLADPAPVQHSPPLVEQPPPTISQAESIRSVASIPDAYVEEASNAYALVAHVERLSNAIGVGRRQQAHPLGH